LDASGRMSFGRLLAEGCLIVFSVLVALGVGEWRENRAKQALARRALNHFRVELTQNLDSVRQVVAYHQELRSKVSGFIKDPSQLEADLDYFVLLQRLAEHGLQPPDLRQAAWDTAVGAGMLALLDYEVSQRLAGTYHAQEMGVNTTIRRISDILFSPAIFEMNRVNQLHLMFGLINELVEQERTMIETYEETLAALPGAAA